MGSAILIMLYGLPLLVAWYVGIIIFCWLVQEYYAAEPAAPCPECAGHHMSAVCRACDGSGILRE